MYNPFELVLFVVNRFDLPWDIISVIILFSLVTLLSFLRYYYSKKERRGELKVSNTDRVMINSFNIFISFVIFISSFILFSVMLPFGYIEEQEMPYGPLIAALLVSVGYLSSVFMNKKRFNN